MARKTVRCRSVASSVDYPSLVSTPELSAHRADARWHLDVLRRRPGSGLAAQHRHGRKPPFTARYSSVVRRLARPLGWQHPRRRRDELQPEDRCLRVAGEPAPYRALDAHRADDARLRGHGRGSDGVDPALDRQAGVEQAKRPGEPDLYRTTLH